jgi:hypothetical protein
MEYGEASWRDKFIEFSQASAFILITITVDHALIMQIFFYHLDKFN